LVVETHKDLEVIWRYVAIFADHRFYNVPLEAKSDFDWQFC
jgi:hypothetical protein